MALITASISSSLIFPAVEAIRPRERVHDIFEPHHLGRGVFEVEPDAAVRLDPTGHRPLAYRRTALRFVNTAFSASLMGLVFSR